MTPMRSWIERLSYEELVNAILDNQEKLDNNEFESVADRDNVSRELRVLQQEEERRVKGEE